MRGARACSLVDGTGMVGLVFEKSDSELGGWGHHFYIWADVLEAVWRGMLNSVKPKLFLFFKI